MDKKIWFSVGIAALTCVGHAQTSEFRPSPRMKEFGIFGSGTSVSGTSSFGVGVDFGYYLTPNLVAVSKASLGGSGSNLGNIFFGGRYEFNSSGELVPYVLAGMAFKTSGSAEHTFQGGAGANLYFRRDLAIFSEISFYRFGNRTRDTTTGLDLGLRVYFK